MVFYFLPGGPRFLRAVDQGVLLLNFYAREHVLFCLVPAFFIAGAIEVFVSDQAVLRYLGPAAPKPVAYGVASVAGAILAVCSCTILPIFAGIYTMGAGLGPAATFLYSGPAINVLAVILTARVLGLDLGLARAVGAVATSILVGLAMAAVFRREDRERLDRMASVATGPGRPLWQVVLFMATLVALLVFATWGEGIGLWQRVHEVKWVLTAAAALALAVELAVFYRVRPAPLAALAAAVAASAAAAGRPEIPFTLGAAGLSVVLYTAGGEARAWFESSYILARKILPLLFLGVFFAGFFLGAPGEGGGLIPARHVAALVGGNSLAANFFASVMAALMYFATLTEVPILQGLIGSGMGPGPALALLLAGPAVSLPSMLVIRSVLGTRKTAVYVALVVTVATLTGFGYGYLAAGG
nr:permease [Dissulfurirhabdus thermomarina]